MGARLEVRAPDRTGSDCIYDLVPTMDTTMKIKDYVARFAH